ncbi:MAG TPA: ATP-binding protein [Bacteroidia bacterium]|nr:ATP-binding protein [Bacteroidia bacterium]
MNETTAPDAAITNAMRFQKEMKWLDRLFRFREYRWRLQRESAMSGGTNEGKSAADDPRYTEVKTLDVFPAAEVEPAVRGNSPYDNFLSHYSFGLAERTALLLSILPHIAPGLLDQYAMNFGVMQGHCPEFGGSRSKNGMLLPTWATLFFLLGGTDMQERAPLFALLDGEHVFRRHRILHFETLQAGTPETEAPLAPELEVTDLLTHGYVRKPVFSNDFPASPLTTNLDWDDLVLSAITKRQITEVKTWLRQKDRLGEELGIGKWLRPGNKILFHGPPGTGKTLTASLLAKFTGKDVFRIDLSMVVSKYIGETEKNLAKVFDKAEHSGWILFFDEADALFGSRTRVSNSHDRYANQEVSYLLQRIEDYDGVIILASNMKGNIDDAFMRRFNAVVHFPFPKAEERKQLWKNAFSEKIIFDGNISFDSVAGKYELSGGSIVNIAAWCQLMALDNNSYRVTDSMIREGISRELAKEGRTL